MPHTRLQIGSALLLALLSAGCRLPGRDGPVSQSLTDCRRLSQTGVAVERCWSTLIHPPGTIVTAAGTFPRVFGRFYERWADRPLPEPVPAGRARILAIAGCSLPAIDGH